MEQRRRLYTLVVERSLSLLKKTGKAGLILPLSLAFSTKRSYVAMREVMHDENGSWWWTHYDRIPSALFGNDVRTRCTIAVFSRAKRGVTEFSRSTSPLLRWGAEEREALFQTIRYSSVLVPIASGIPKLSSTIQAITLQSLHEREHRLVEDLLHPLSFSTLATMAPDFPSNSVYVGGVAYNWFPAWRTIPPTTTQTGQASLPARTAGFRFSDSASADAVFAMLCSSLGYWWWATASDGFNLKKWLLERFPLSLNSLPPAGKKELAELGNILARELERNYVYKDNKGRVGNYFLPACQAIIDQIDTCLSKHVHGLSDEFFLDIRDFNSSFSTAQVPDEEVD
jgi:hypothetical protein